jgi:Amt family ammonium transporter
VQVAIDDFGTGYSSLSYLTTLPVDVVKIDQSFIAALGSDAKGDVLVRSLVEMTKNLGIRTVAEGVETRVQLDRLRAIGCDAAQGFLFARPLSTPVFHLPDVLPFGDSVGGNVGIV